MEIQIKGEWYFQYDDGPIEGPFLNSMEAAGLTKLAERFATLSSPYIAMGDAVGELFRKAVGVVIQSGAICRFRSTLSLSEAVDDYTWIALYSDATASPGSGIKINQLNQVFSKTLQQVLNVECKFTMQQGV